MGSRSIEIEAMSLGDSLNQDAAIGNPGLSSQTESITYMDPILYKAAAKGDIYAFKDFGENLDLLLTPNKNTVLHIHVTALCGETMKPMEVAHEDDYMERWIKFRIKIKRILFPRKMTFFNETEAKWSLCFHIDDDSTNFVKNIFQKCPSLLMKANARGETPLHIAARHGHSDTVKVLIKCAKALHEQELERGVGAAREMMRMTNTKKDTALHEAVRFNQLSVVQLLTKEDPEFSDSANDAGESPLYLAAERGVEVAREMMRMTNTKKDTALHEAVLFNQLSVVQLLTKEDPEFSDSANDAGETPLFLAAERGFHQLVSEILSTCKSPNHGGPNGRTALHAAVIHNDEGMTKEILERKGALAKEADQQGWTPLHYAAHLGHVSMVKLLLQYDKSAAYFADTDGKRTALHIAAGNGHVDIMKELISSCPDCCELVDKRGWNVLHFAVESGYKEAVGVIFENSSLVDLINEKDNEGNSPLHRFAASLSYIPAFIKHPKVDKMALNNKDLSPLDITLANKSLDVEMKEYIVECLKNAGARAGQRSITYKDDGGIGNDDYKDDGGIGDDDEYKDYSSKFDKERETHLIVAALIATVSFAAGFTMPGGYMSDKDLGLELGTAVLIRKASFRAFVISDTVALAFSSTAVFLHILLSLTRSKRKLVTYFSLASLFTIVAMVAMVVAFMTGVYAVLVHSSEFAHSICFTTSIVFTFSFATPIVFFINETRSETNENVKTNIGVGGKRTVRYL